jgi:hypothetical protein
MQMMIPALTPNKNKVEKLQDASPRDRRSIFDLIAATSISRQRTRDHTSLFRHAVPQLSHAVMMLDCVDRDMDIYVLGYEK